MTNKDKAKLDKQRKKQSLLSFYFNRFIFVRYISALFFFTLLYWLLALYVLKTSLLIIPLVMILIMIPSIYEQFSLYSEPINNAKKTVFAYRVYVMIIAAILMATLLDVYYLDLFPFLANTEGARIFISCLLFVYLVLGLLVLYKLNLIKNNRDKHYQRIKQYERSINLRREKNGR